MMAYTVPPDRPNRDGLPRGPVPLHVALDREESHLHFPESRVLQQYLNDEQASVGIEDVNRGTHVRKFLLTRASEQTVLGWYHRELTSRGWTLASGNPAKTMHVFVRGDTEIFTLVMRRRGEVGRPSSAPRDALVYEFLYQIEGSGTARRRESAD